MNIIKGQIRRLSSVVSCSFGRCSLSRHGRRTIRSASSSFPSTRKQAPMWTDGRRDRSNTIRRVSRYINNQLVRAGGFEVINPFNQGRPWNGGGIQPYSRTANARGLGPLAAMEVDTEISRSMLVYLVWLDVDHEHHTTTTICVATVLHLRREAYDSGARSTWGPAWTGSFRYPMSGSRLRQMQ